MRPFLDDMALFVEVVTAGGFTLAAERLDMPPSTLSRRIAGLERRIGFKLLHRTTRRVEPTAEGQAYFKRCQPLLEEAALAHEAIVANRSTVTGTLRVACTADFANAYLSTCLKRYLEEHPRASVDLSLSSRVEDLLANQLDLAIRLGPLRDSGLVAHPLGALQPGVYASPRLLERVAAPGHPMDLESVPCIRIGAAESAARWRFTPRDSTSAQDAVTVSVAGRVAAGGPQMTAQFTAQGLGVGVLDRRLADPLVMEGRLVELLTHWQPAPVPVHAVTPSRLMPARVRRFIDLLKTEIDIPSSALPHPGDGDASKPA